MLPAPISLPESDTQVSPQPGYDLRGPGLMSIAVMNWAWANSPTSGNVLAG